MAGKTPLDEASARTLLAEWGLALERLEALPAHGTVNSNFRLRASGADWFLRVNEGKTDGDVAEEAGLVVWLRARGVPTPEVVPTWRGRPFARLGDKPVTLFPWVAGHEAAPDADAPSTVGVVGQALGTLHLAGRDLGPTRCPRNHYSLDELAERVASFAGDSRLRDVAELLDGELERARRRPRLPSGLIHQDLFPDNLLVSDDGELRAILDLEQATHGALVYDLAVALNAWCWNGTRIVRAAAESVIDAYGALRPLTADERLALPDEARLAAARFAITRVTDVFLPEGVDPSLRARKDYRDYLRRLEFWRSA